VIPGVFLFILESIGTSELVLIGIVALIFLGPRQMPQIARKIGKIMAEFRSTTHDFKSTWEREVNFEEEERALRTAFEDDKPEAIARENSNSILPPSAISAPAEPQVKEIDPAVFQNKTAETANGESLQTVEDTQLADPRAKQNWL
jgi:sec-independent protein translocase protein TatB